MTFRVRGTQNPLEAEGVCDCGKIVGRCGCNISSGYNPNQTDATSEDLNKLPPATCPGCQKK